MPAIGEQLSQFPGAGQIQNADLFYMSQGGVSVSATAAQVQAAMAVNNARETFTAGPTFTGSISSTTLTASAVSGTIVAGQTLFGAGVTANSVVQPYGTNGTTGTGGAGTYALSQSSTVGSGESMAAASATQFAPGFSSSITLAGTYGSINNIDLYFDATPQLDSTLAGQILSFNPIVPSGVQQVVVIGGTARSIAVTADSTVTDAKLAPGSMVYNRIYGNKTVVDWGAKGDGVTDDSAAFQAAINSGVCRIPYSAKGYMVKTPLNGANLQSLVIEGVDCVQPHWSLGYVSPLGGSVIFANTGTWLLDITGSNNVQIRNLTISSCPFQAGTGLTMATPSTGGIIGGTSTANPSGLNYPGGAGYIFENITVMLANVAPSLPIYINNGNIGRYTNIATLGQYGFCLTGGNPLAQTPPYNTFGTVTQSDTNIVSGYMGLSYGQNAVMYFEQANDLTVLESYHSYGGGLAGGPYSGVGYSTYLNNCSNCKLKLGVDNFPFMFRMDGVISQVDIEGLISQGGTATPVGNPAIGFINATSIKNCNFKVIQFDNRPNNNYLYATQGAAVLASMFGCNFWLDNSETPNMIYFNASNINPVPYFNNNFTANQDFSVGTTPMVLQVNGSPATASQYRINMNGNRQGTA